MALWPFQPWLAREAGSLWPSSAPLDTPRRTPTFFILRFQGDFLFSILLGECRSEGRLKTQEFLEFYDGVVISTLN
jgi:hypothetical protein